MSTLRPSWIGIRVAIAVAALYALALQGFLGGVFSVGPSGPAHHLCAEASNPGDGPTKPSPIHAGCDCCTAAHVQPLNHAPLMAVSAIVWPRRDAISLRWRPEIVAVPRAPPRFRAQARAPPVV